MGRWTPKYYDQVLVTKIENLVNGIIGRCRQEEEEDSKARVHMSYEKFVESLQEGDAFTTALFEVLVKELADRQTRRDATEKNLISAQTVESLQKLAGFSSYHRPYSRQRNRSNMTIDAAISAAHAPFDPSDSPDDDDFEDASMIDSFGGVEGARMDSSLFDMYRDMPPIVSPGSMRSLPYMSAHTQLPRPSDLPTFRLHDVNASRPQLPHFPQNTLPRLSSNRMAPSSSRPNVALQRQLSIRRAARNRMTDFNEFASRRRNSQRTQPEGDRSSTSSGTFRPSHSPIDDTSPVIPPPPPGYPLSPLPRASLFEPPSPRSRDLPLPSPSPPPEPEDSGPFRRGSWGPYTSGISLAASLGLLGSPEATRPEHIPQPGASPPPRRPPRRGGLRPRASTPVRPDLSPDTLQASETVSLLRPERSLASEGGLRFDQLPVDLEHDFQEWFNPADLSLLQASRDEPPPSMPTPRSISPPENSEAGRVQESNRNSEVTSPR